MQMPCSNTQSEMDNDTDTDHSEQARFIAEEARWIRIVNDLLAGKSVEMDNGSKVNLADRLSNEYQEFADFVDQDFDFIAHYHAGKFCNSVNELIRQEARTFASIILG